MPKTALQTAPSGVPDRKVDPIRHAYRRFSEKGVHVPQLDDLQAQQGRAGSVLVTSVK